MRHQIVERKGDVVTAKCGAMATTDEVQVDRRSWTIWTCDVTCPGCKPTEPSAEKLGLLSFLP